MRSRTAYTAYFTTYKSSSMPHQIVYTVQIRPCQRNYAEEIANNDWAVSFSSIIQDAFSVT